MTVEDDRANSPLEEQIFGVILLVPLFTVFLIILGGYGDNNFLFALIDADASFSFLTQQMLLKKGLKHFQNKGVEALLAEMSQLHYRKTIKPALANSMTREQKRQALRYQKKDWCCWCRSGSFAEQLESHYQSVASGCLYCCD
jgi:hypothetical protein